MRSRSCSTPMYCHFSILTRKNSRETFLGFGFLALAFLCGALAVPARADDVLATRARDILAAHCAPCRDVASDGVTLDLTALARDPTLIRPGNPDGSPIYVE